jgi:prefoldin subunit 5
MSSSSTVNNESMDAIKKYSSFVEDTLKPQLKESLQKRDEITQELVEYKELEDLVFELIKQRQTHQANSQPHKLKTLMDLGQKFQVHAKIPNTSMIIIDIGLNFHVEMTLEEAKEFIIGHLKHLKR